MWTDQQPVENPLWTINGLWKIHYGRCMSGGTRRPIMDPEKPSGRLTAVANVAIMAA